MMIVKRACKVGLVYLFLCVAQIVASEQLLEKCNIVTFLPIQEYSDKYAENIPDIIVSLKKRSGIIKINNKLYQVCRSIPDKIKENSSPVTLYAGGYSNAGKPYGYCVYNAIKGGIITGPAIVFDYPTDASMRDFNFCQEKDLACLDRVYQELLRVHPKSVVILLGACKGAMNKLRFLAEAQDKNVDLKNIKALIAESPVISPYHALKNQFCGSLAHWLMQYIFPSYDIARLKTIMDARSFPSKIPVLLGSLPEDTVSELPDMITMKNHLEGLGATVEHFVAQEDDANIIHGQIGKSKGWQEKVNQFLAVKGLNS